MPAKLGVLGFLGKPYPDRTCPADLRVDMFTGKRTL